MHNIVIPPHSCSTWLGVGAGVQPVSRSALVQTIPSLNVLLLVTLNLDFFPKQNPQNCGWHKKRQTKGLIS